MLEELLDPVHEKVFVDDKGGEGEQVILRDKNGQYWISEPWDDEQPGYPLSVPVPPDLAIINRADLDTHNAEAHEGHGLAQQSASTLPLIEDTDGESILRWLKDEPLTTARMDHMLGNWGSGKTESALERLHSYGYVQCEGNNRYYSLWSLTGKGKEAAA